MRKFIANRITIIVAVIMLMVATTAISFAYWKTGLVGSETENKPQINIGTGSALDSSVSFASVTFNADAELIPHTRTPKDDSNEFNELEITYSVRWTAAIPSGSGDLDEEQKKGQLTVTCTSILVGGVEFIDAKGAGGVSLFIIEDKSAQIIVNGSAVPIVMTIKLNEPANKAQYEQIAGKNVQFTFLFTVISQDDANQL